jgi:hypothetical protein
MTSPKTSFCRFASLAIIYRISSPQPSYVPSQVGRRSDTRRQHHSGPIGRRRRHAEFVELRHADNAVQRLRVRHIAAICETGAVVRIHSHGKSWVVTNWIVDSGQPLRGFPPENACLEEAAWSGHCIETKSVLRFKPSSCAAVSVVMSTEGPLQKVKFARNSTLGHPGVLILTLATQSR